MYYYLYANRVRINAGNYIPPAATTTALAADPTEEKRTREPDNACPPSRRFSMAPSRQLPKKTLPKKSTPKMCLKIDNLGAAPPIFVLHVQSQL